MYSILTKQESQNALLCQLQKNYDILMHINFRFVWLIADTNKKYVESIYL